MKKRIALLLALTMLFSTNVYGFEAESSKKESKQENAAQRVDTKTTTWNLDDIYTNEAVFEADLVRAEQKS